MIPREFFRDNELVCHCGCGLLPPIGSVERLYAVRTMVGHPMPISSAARCKKHNKASGGKGGSMHLPPQIRTGASAGWGGQAFDIIANHQFQAEIYAVALTVGFTGFGFAETFIHIDDGHPVITHWRY